MFCFGNTTIPGIEVYMIFQELQWPLKKRKKKKKGMKEMILKEPKTLCILNFNFFLLYVQYLMFKKTPHKIRSSPPYTNDSICSSRPLFYSDYLKKNLIKCFISFISFFLNDMINPI